VPEQYLRFNRGVGFRVEREETGIGLFHEYSIGRSA
jgi:hypothetical protein